MVFLQKIRHNLAKNADCFVIYNKKKNSKNELKNGKTIKYNKFCLKKYLIK